MDTGMIREGMTVYSRDGKRLGKIIRQDADSLVIEKGLFFKKDFVARRADVDRVDADEVWLALDAAHAEAERHEEEPERRRSTPAAGGAPGDEERAAGGGMYASSASDSGEQDVVVVMEEEVLYATPTELEDDARLPGRGKDKDPHTKE
jgi:hypothetical protein